MKWKRFKRKEILNAKIYFYLNANDRNKVTSDRKSILIKIPAAVYRNPRNNSCRDGLSDAGERGAAGYRNCKGR